MQAAARAAWKARTVGADDAGGAGGGAGGAVECAACSAEGGTGCGVEEPHRPQPHCQMNIDSFDVSNREPRSGISHLVRNT